MCVCVCVCVCARVTYALPVLFKTTVTVTVTILAYLYQIIAHPYIICSSCCKPETVTHFLIDWTHNETRSTVLASCNSLKTTHYYDYYYYWTSIIKVSLSRKTSRTLYISQRYKKTAERKFSTVELGKGNSEKTCLQPAPEGAECLWRCDGKLFQTRGAATKKARSPIVERRDDGVTRAHSYKEHSTTFWQSPV